jgi:hypothetical protein
MGMKRCPGCGHDAPVSFSFCPKCGTALPAPGGEATGANLGQVEDLSPLPVRTPTPFPEASRFAAGQVLAGRYRIVNRLGKGGMGEVYRADDLKLGQSVALKFLPEKLAYDTQRLALFHEEVKLARQVSHPNVCRVYDIAEVDQQSFVSIEYVDGEDLASLLRRIGRLPQDKGIEIARQLCLGLAAAHDKGVLHRDLKPANIMIDGRGQVRIIDFGLARLLESLNPEPSSQRDDRREELDSAHAKADGRSIAGTVGYMAPELFAGKEATVRSDLYALGVVLYEVFTGKRPFKVTSLAVFRQLQEESAPPHPSSHVSGLDPVIERVILRCLEKQPHARPNSAIAVAAALPGGDPLAAALAAGETPSPEMVAAAGQSSVWPPRFAVACLAGTVVGLVLCVLFFSKAMLVGRVGMPEPTEVLTRKARDILKRLGFEESKDSAIGFDHDEDYLRWIQDKDRAPERWDQLTKSRPAALYFWYRQSPTYLVPNLFYPYQGTLEPGRITLSEPAPVVPGMVSVKLDLHGRLLELHAVPPAQTPNGAKAKTPDWAALFAAAELDLKQFTETEALHVPPVFADTRQGWTGTFPERADVPIRLEAATLYGRLVYFQILGPWSQSEQKAAGSQGTLDQGGLMVMAVLFAGGLVAAAVLAPRNWQLGRADRKGAFRLAFWSFVILMVVWLVETHHVPSIDELQLLILGFAFALSWSGLLWLTYIALEPYVRRLWPQALITWTRLLAGQWRDPRLGRDLLLGTLVGVLLALVDQLGRVAPAWLGATTPVPYWDWWIPNTMIRGYWIGNFLLNLIYSFRWAFFFKLLLFLVLRVVLRRQLPAAAVYVVLAAALYVGTSAGLEPSWFWVFAILIETLFIILLIRVGVLATIAAMFVWYCLYFPITTDLTSWYAQNSLMALGAVVLIGGYGFHISVAGRSLFEDELLSK